MREEKVSRENPKRTVERGLYYYGARYYDPKVSVWLSVDALAQKYPSLSPYAYVGNNPVNAIDPDGNRIVPTNAGAKRAVTGVLSLYSKNYQKLFKLDKNSPNVFQTAGGYKNFEQFQKAASKHGVADRDVASAWQVYQAIADKDDVEITLINTAESATTLKSGEGGSTVGNDPNFEDPNTVNADYRDFIIKVDEIGQVDQSTSNDLFKENKYNADVKGKGYVIFGDYDYYQQNLQTPRGHILIDGSQNNTGISRSTLESLSRIKF